MATGPCSPRRLFLLVLLLVAAGPAGTASALSLTLAGPGVGPVTGGTASKPAQAGDPVTLSVGLDVATQIVGYDVTITWDPTELDFVSASDIPGLAFDTAPTAGQFAGARVSAIDLSAVTTDLLFSVSFVALDPIADGLPDFRVFVDAMVNGAGIAPGSLSLANPAGAAIDIVPEPGSGLLLGLGLAGAWLLRRPRGRARRPPA